MALGAPVGCPICSRTPMHWVAPRFSRDVRMRMGTRSLRGYSVIQLSPTRPLALAVSKQTRITERVSTRFDVQFVNAFNHVMFGSGGDSYFSNQPGMDLSGPGAFGVPSNQFNSPRYIQMGLRFDF